MYPKLIDPTPRRCELNISPIDAFVVAQETRPLALPHTHTILNQQARHSFLRNHFKQDSIEQTGNPKHCDPLWITNPFDSREYCRNETR
jgi:hypothetical protein